MPKNRTMKFTIKSIITSLLLLVFNVLLLIVDGSSSSSLRGSIEGITLGVSFFIYCTVLTVHFAVCINNNIGINEKRSQHP